MKARLILEDGTVFKGKAFGYLEEYKRISW